jgi:enoyl-CoA hydratase
MAINYLSVTVEGHVAEVTFDRGPVNALNVTAMHQFISTFGELARRDDVRVVVLTGAGATFCAGIDRRLFTDETADSPDQATFLSVHRAFFVAVREFAKPTIAAVNGPAVGAGFALAGSCDIMVASDTAYFSMPEVAVGQPSGAAFVTRMFGQSKGRRLFFTGDRIGAPEMFRLGLVEACAPKDELMAEARRIADAIARNDLDVLRAAKQTCLIAAEVPYSVSKTLEYSTIDQITRDRLARTKPA